MAVLHLGSRNENGLLALALVRGVSLTPRCSRSHAF
jgi:hypothetical protein